jgi:hypothetical protein
MTRFRTVTPEQSVKQFQPRMIDVEPISYVMVTFRPSMTAPY